MKHFLSCDWGTSSFRLKLVNKETLETAADVHHDRGIAATNFSWQKESNGQSRFLFFASVIANAIGDLEKKIMGPLTGIPVILSGMASSSIGMIQLPYKKMPFKTDGSDLKVENVKASKDFNHDVFIISGVCSDNEVMRGEETQLVGCADQSSAAEIVYILPGTHSKHISVKGTIATEFRTYMTGEFFSLLSKNSTLTESVVGSSGENNMEGFVQGVRDSVNTNLLNQLFRVRTRMLLGQVSPVVNRSYLSGLLIGSEVYDLVNRKMDEIKIISSTVGDHYKIALETLKIGVPFSVSSDAQATVRGQLKVLSYHGIG